MKISMNVVILMIVILFLTIIFLFNYMNSPIKLNTGEADIVIIGLGTAGSIMARRLHDNLPNHKIIVLERGNNKRNDPNVYNTSKAALVAYNDKYSSLLKSDNSNVQVTIGSMYGGSSSHNFGLVVHGSPEYYNMLKQYIGLSYSDQISYFKRIEKYSGKSQNKFLRGDNGNIQIYQLPTKLNVFNNILPLVGRFLSQNISQGINTISKSINVLQNMGPLRASDNFSNIMITAINKLKSVPVVEDYNAGINLCVSASQQLFIDNITGLRSSTDVAYLPMDYIMMDDIGNAKKNNLQIVPNATVNKFTAAQVEWFDKDGNVKITRLSRNGASTVDSIGHIILCAGGIYSPFLLQKSGFKNKNIGSNLQTHYGCTMILSVQADKNEDFNFSAGPLAFLPRTSNGGSSTREWQIICGGKALLNKKLLQNIGIDSDIEQQNNPNLRYFVFLLWTLKPKTRGNVSFDPMESTVLAPSHGQEHLNDNMVPKIELKLFEDGNLENKDSDLSTIVDGLKFMNQIAQKMKETYPTLIPVYPPQSVFQKNDNNELAKYVKEGVSMTDHYSATCAIGTVINAKDFSVIGNPNIHVVDASVFPIISDGNTEFPTCVIAELASDRISNLYKN